MAARRARAVMNRRSAAPVVDEQGNEQAAAPAGVRMYDQEEGIPIEYVGGAARHIRSRAIPSMSYYFASDSGHRVVDVHPADASFLLGNTQFRKAERPSAIVAQERRAADEQEQEQTDEQVRQDAARIIASRNPSTAGTTAAEATTEATKTDQDEE